MLAIMMVSTLAMMMMVVVMMMVVMLLSTLTTLSSSKGGAARTCQDCSVPAAAMWPNLQKMVFVCVKKGHFTSSVDVNFLSTYIFMHSFNVTPLFLLNSNEDTTSLTYSTKEALVRPPSVVFLLLDGCDGSSKFSFLLLKMSSLSSASSACGGEF